MPLEHTFKANQKPDIRRGADTTVIVFKDEAGNTDRVELPTAVWREGIARDVRTELEQLGEEQTAEFEAITTELATSIAEGTKAANKRLRNLRSRMGLVQRRDGGDTPPAAPATPAEPNVEIRAKA